MIPGQNLQSPDRSPQLDNGVPPRIFCQAYSIDTFPPLAACSASFNNLSWFFPRPHVRYKFPGTTIDFPLCIAKFFLHYSITLIDIKLIYIYLYIYIYSCIY